MGDHQFAQGRGFNLQHLKPKYPARFFAVAAMLGCLWRPGDIHAQLLNIVLGSVPTITGGEPGAASALHNPTFHAYNDPAFTYWFPTTNVVLNGLPEIGGGPVDATNTFAPLQVSFRVTDAVNFEWETLENAYGSFQVDAFDGMTHYYSDPILEDGLYPNSSPTLYLVGLPYAANWNISICLAMDADSTGLFAGVNTAPGSTLEANSLPAQRKLVVLGDSYAMGYVPAQFYTLGIYYAAQWLNGFAMDLRYYGAHIQVYPAGVSGQGYVNAYNVPPVYQDRTTNDVLRIHPNFVLVTGSVNDHGFPSNEIFTAALSLYMNLTNLLPNAQIAVIGNWYGIGGDTIPSADDIYQDQALEAAARIVGLPYASPVRLLWGPGGVGSDNVHPTVQRYAQFAYDISTNLVNWWGKNWTYGAPPPSTNADVFTKTIHEKLPPEK